MTSTRLAPTQAAEQPTSAPTALRISGLSHGFGELEVLEGLSLEVAEGDVLGLVGSSGCGKTTLLELVAGLIEPAAGSVEVAPSPGMAPEADAASRLRSCALMPQRDLLLPWFSALDNAALALRNRGVRRGEARKQVASLFERFGLAQFEQTAPAQLSGGMRQRVAFLRTLVTGKPVLLLDEPFGALDAITRADMQAWLGSALGAEPRTTLLVTHDVEEALYLCDRVVVLSARPGRIVAELKAPSPRAGDRDHAVTEPSFIEARENAMQALREGAP